MRTGKSLLGLKVVGESDGVDLGHVKDLIFDHDANQILALLMSDKDLFGLIDAQIIPWDQISRVGEDVITVASRDSRVHAGDDARVKNLLTRTTALSGTRIYSSDGKELGSLADTCVDDTTGHIEGYEVSGGFISDTLHGKRFLPAGEGLTIGSDAAVIESGKAQSFEEKKQRQANELNAPSPPRNESADYDIRSAEPDVQREFVIGETAARDVMIADETLVRRGETITATHAARASVAGVLPQLVDAAASSAA